MLLCVVSLCDTQLRCYGVIVLSRLTILLTLLK
jgi:hypothetical protein